MTNPLTITTGFGVHGDLIQAEGEIDLATAGELRDALDAVFATDHSSATVVVDLTGVTFMDSAGLSVLLRAAKRAKATGRQLTVAAIPAGPVRRVLDLSGLGTIFPVVDEPGTAPL
ncbi:STAS domain-containing protein [Actinokineospora auranticolor]|uniref:Anti-sigma factor antagonist n=1 Tax=Actinokineospora auranticolor TaxID=155976 RepID=A0A2S6GIC8_9PSEU|nr:STAS domain-containing protein [Actinokineospora auranticolor]PPK64984.1 anti-sigma B factor antagonist [Actinokineospora auranticolor]